MIHHLWEKTAIKMTTSQKFEDKAEGYGKQWDPTSSIMAYFTGLEVSNLSCQPQHCNKHQGNDDGSGRKNVGEQDVHQGPNRLRGQTRPQHSKPGRISRITSQKNG
jgi:hypothetical protein